MWGVRGMELKRENTNDRKQGDGSFASFLLHLAEVVTITKFEGSDGMQVGMTVKEVNRETWPDLEKLFDGSGGPKYCWCMAWRARGEETKHTDGESRRAYLKARVDAGIPVGILVCQNGEPVAWCSAYPVDHDSPSYRFMGFVPVFQQHHFVETGRAGSRRHVMRLKLN